jgi:AbrB family looped-hinge helix DNA binding protein
MEITVKKWGSSLGIVIPRVIAKGLDLKEGSSVEIEDREGVIVISPGKNTLSDLLDKINDSNLHGETDSGISLGREVW